MKAKDLQIGPEYCYNTSDSWVKWSNPGERAVVVDATPGHYYYDHQQSTWVRSPIRGGGCQSVLVDLYPAEGQTKPGGTRRSPRRASVRTQALRGLWDDCVRQRAEHAEAKETARHKTDELMEKIGAPCAEAVALLGKLGVVADARTNSHYKYAEVRVGHVMAPVLVRALRHLVDSGWTTEA